VSEEAGAAREVKATVGNAAGATVPSNERPLSHGTTQPCQAQGRAPAWSPEIEL